MIRVVVFDLDDTLYPQVEFKRSGFRAVARWLGETHRADPERAWAVLEQILNDTGPSCASHFDLAVAAIGLAPSVVPAMVRVFREHAPAIALHPGAREALEPLVGRVRLGLLTDGPGDVQRRKVEALGIAEVFDAVLYSDDLGTAKPDPRLFAWFEKSFGVPGDRCAYVGDNPAKDFVGARKRGWRTVRVLAGEHARTPAPEGFEAQKAAGALEDCIRLVLGSGWLPPPLDTREKPDR